MLLMEAVGQRSSSRTITTASRLSASRLSVSVAQAQHWVVAVVAAHLPCTLVASSSQQQAAVAVVMVTSAVFLLVAERAFQMVSVPQHPQAQLNTRALEAAAPRRVAAARVPRAAMALWLCKQQVAVTLLAASVVALVAMVASPLVAHKLLGVEGGSLAAQEGVAPLLMVAVVVEGTVVVVVAAQCQAVGVVEGQHGWTHLYCPLLPVAALSRVVLQGNLAHPLVPSVSYKWTRPAPPPSHLRMLAVSYNRVPHMLLPTSADASSPSTFRVELVQVVMKQ